MGNALPDALATFSLAKDPNKATLAISGGYAGQLFGLLVGFGLSMLKSTITDGNQKFDLFDSSKIDENLLDIMVIGVIALVLVLTFLWGVCYRMQMTKPLGWIMVIMYIGFFVAATIIAVINAAKDY